MLRPASLPGTVEEHPAMRWMKSKAPNHRDNAKAASQSGLDDSPRSSSDRFGNACAPGLDMGDLRIQKSQNHPKLFPEPAHDQGRVLRAANHPRSRPDDAALDLSVQGADQPLVPLEERELALARGHGATMPQRVPHVGRDRGPLQNILDALAHSTGLPSGQVAGSSSGGGSPWHGPRSAARKRSSLITVRSSAQDGTSGRPALRSSVVACLPFRTRDSAVARSP